MFSAVRRLNGPLPTLAAFRASSSVSACRGRPRMSRFCACDFMSFALLVIYLTNIIWTQALRPDTHGGRYGRALHGAGLRQTARALQDRGHGVQVLTHRCAVCSMINWNMYFKCKYCLQMGIKRWAISLERRLLFHCLPPSPNCENNPLALCPSIQP